MRKRSLGLHLTVVLMTLTLTSSALAGDTHCPLTDPPPDETGRQIQVAIGDSISFKTIWEIFIQGAALP
jgi:hypothetical protein